MKNKNSLSKKFLFCLLVLVLSGGTIVAMYGQSIALGDVNESGKVDIVDAMFIAQYVSSIPPRGFNASVADVNCDNTINVIDALIVARYSAGILPAPACSSTPTPTPIPIRTAIPVAGHIINAKSAKLITTGSASGSTLAVQRAIAYPSYSNNIQNWKYTAQPLGYYAIVNQTTGMALTVENNSRQPGAYVVAGAMSSSAAGTSQQWQFFTTPSGYLKIVNRESGLCLAVENASLLDEARLVQVADGNGSELLWATVEPAPQPCPTCCDYDGAFCINISENKVVRENAAEPVVFQVSARKLFLRPTATPAGGSNILVDYTVRGKATNGVDVEYLSGQVAVFAYNYPYGDTSSPPADGKINIKLIDDIQPEGVEPLFIDLSFSAATVTNDGVLYIVDDDIQ